MYDIQKIRAAFFDLVCERLSGGSKTGVDTQEEYRMRCQMSTFIGQKHPVRVKPCLVFSHHNFRLISGKTDELLTSIQITNIWTD